MESITSGPIATFAENVQSSCVLHGEVKDTLDDKGRKTLLVIGGGGYIGSTVVFRALTTTMMRVIVFDRLMYGGSSLFQFFSFEGRGRFKFVHGDVRMGIERWEVFLREHRVDFIFNAAALVGEPICKKFPEDAQQINEDAPIDIAEAAARTGCRRYIFASTCSNYGKTEDFVDETAPTFALSLYATTKINTEQYLMRSVPHLPCTVLRFATIYGLASRVRFDLLVHEFIRDAWNHKRVEIYGPDGWRPFLHVDDAARAVIMVCEQHATVPPKEIFNVGADEQNFQKKVLGALIQERLPQCKVVYRTDIVDKRSYKVDFSKIKCQLGFVPIHDPRVSIDQLCTGLECGMINSRQLDESVNVSKDDAIRKDRSEHIHVTRSHIFIAKVA